MGQANDVGEMPLMMSASPPLSIGPPMYRPLKYHVARRMTVSLPDPCRHTMLPPVHRIQFGRLEMMLPATVPTAPSIRRYTTLLMRCQVAMLAVQERTGIPVKLVGTGEGIGDLTGFTPHAFVAQLLS